MATRNPLNQRYQGEGPGGQTRKSASSAKPATKAASSVNVKKKPTTASEKRAAAKAREKEAAQKAKEKAAKQAERAKAAAIEAEKMKAANTESEAAKSETPANKPRGILDYFKNSSNDTPKTPVAPIKTEEYLRWKKIYWILLAIGMIALLLSLGVSNSAEYGAPAFIALMIVAYSTLIASFYINYRKMRPLEKRNTATTAKKSPKALKHEQEAREQAAQVEAARKAAKAKKKNKQEQGKSPAPTGVSTEEDEMGN